MRTITYQQAQTIIDHACQEWKELLFDYWGWLIITKEKAIEIPEAFYEKMRRVCTPEQHILFNSIFGEDGKSVYLIHQNQKQLFEENGGGESCMIAVRKFGEYKDKAFSLSHRFNWEIKRDSKNLICLIPTRKD